MKDIRNDVSWEALIDECFEAGKLYSESPNAIQDELLREVGEDVVREIHASFDWDAILAEDQLDQLDNVPEFACAIVPSLIMSKREAFEFHSNTADLAAAIDRLMEWSHRTLPIKQVSILSNSLWHDPIQSHVSAITRDLEVLGQVIQRLERITAGPASLCETITAKITISSFNHHVFEKPKKTCANFPESVLRHEAFRSNTNELARAVVEAMAKSDDLLHGLRHCTAKDPLESQYEPHFSRNEQKWPLSLSLLTAYHRDD